MDTTTPPNAASIIATLRAHEAELRAAGIKRLAEPAFKSRLRANIERDRANAF